MPRAARIVVPGYPHHVTQRGNRRADVFEDNSDRRFYLSLLRKYCALHGVEIWAYCLMSNHVHFIAVPGTAAALSRAFHATHSIYTRWFNDRKGQSGHVFQGRFYSTVLDEEHLWVALRYVERNPVRAALVANAEAYPWSSAAAHCLGRFDPVLTRGFPPPNIIDDWSHWLSGDDHNAVEAVRRATHTGRPCGGADFIERLEQLLGRNVAPKKRGRPRKK